MACRLPDTARYKICSVPFWECFCSYSSSGRGTPSRSMYARLPMRTRLLSHQAAKPRPWCTSRSLIG